MEKKEKLELKALQLENEYMKENIKKLRGIIEYQEKQYNELINSKGHKLLEKLRKLKNWRR